MFNLIFSGILADLQNICEEELKEFICQGVGKLDSAPRYGVTF